MINRTDGSAGHPRTIATLLTPYRPGAIGIIQLMGEVEGVLAALSGVPSWPIGGSRLVRIPDLDEFLATRLDRTRAQLTPHGGPRIVEALCARLVELGARLVPPAECDPFLLYPEAEDRVEALALAAIARCASGRGVDLLLAQPRRWRSMLAPDGTPLPLTPEEVARSHRLDRLIAPASVVLVGAPNIGKSSLTNALFSREIALTADFPGTTRDYVTGEVELDGLVVLWHDTPGVAAEGVLPKSRDDDAAVDTRAQQAARRSLESADCVIAAADVGSDWPRIDRSPDLRLGLRDDLGRRADADCSVCARTGEGLLALSARIRALLVSDEDLAFTGRWSFDPRLHSPIEE